MEEFKVTHKTLPDKEVVLHPHFIDWLSKSHLCHSQSSCYLFLYNPCVLCAALEMIREQYYSVRQQVALRSGRRLPNGISRLQKSPPCKSMEPWGHTRVLCSQNEWPVVILPLLGFLLLPTSACLLCSLPSQHNLQPQ